MIKFLSGAAEIRTLVQTKRSYAFYMFSLFLNFRRQAGVQTTNYLLIFLSFDSLPKRKVSIPSASAKRSGHYTLESKDIGSPLHSAKSYANSKLGS